MNDEIVLVRHAETEMAGSFCGHSNPPLSMQGLEQLPALIHKLAKWKSKWLYSSDLLRAQQTAEAIAKENLSSIEFRAGLREIFFGKWEGLTWTEIEAQDREEARLWLEEYPHRPIPGGETYQHFADRVKAEADFLFEQAKDGRAMAVTHAGVMRTILSLRCHISDQQAWQWTKDYCAVVVITQQGKVTHPSMEISHE